MFQASLQQEFLHGLHLEPMAASYLRGGGILKSQSIACKQHRSLSVKPLDSEPFFAVRWELWNTNNETFFSGGTKKIRKFTASWFISRSPPKRRAIFPSHFSLARHSLGLTHVLPLIAAARCKRAKRAPNLCAMQPVPRSAWVARWPSPLPVAAQSGFSASFLELPLAWERMAGGPGMSWRLPVPASQLRQGPPA